MMDFQSDNAEHSEQGMLWLNKNQERKWGRV